MQRCGTTTAPTTCQHRRRPDERRATFPKCLVLGRLCCAFRTSHQTSLTGGPRGPEKKSEIRIRHVNHPFTAGPSVRRKIGALCKCPCCEVRRRLYTHDSKSAEKLQRCGGSRVFTDETSARLSSLAACSERRRAAHWCSACRSRTNRCRSLIHRGPRA